MDYFEHTGVEKPKHGQEGEYRMFYGEWVADANMISMPYYTGDRGGCDIYCANCNHWNTVKNTNILYSVVGECKNCKTKFKNYEK